MPRSTIHRPTARLMIIRAAICAVALVSAMRAQRPASAESAALPDSLVAAVVAELVARHPGADAARLERGVRQVARLWRDGDGPADEFRAFCEGELIASPGRRLQTAERLEAALAAIDGHFGEMGRELSWHLAVDTGPILSIDEMIARYEPDAHLSEDLFRTRLAFTVLLNYPQYTLEERLALGPGWSRQQWAEARLAGRFLARVPPEVAQTRRLLGLEAGNYIRDYNIWMHHVLDAGGERLFPPGMKLIAHWNLRDELKSLYAEETGLAGQELIYEVMLRIIRQEIPAVVVNNPGVDWQPATGRVTVSPAVDGPMPEGWAPGAEPGEPVDNAPEQHARYARLLDVFHGQELVDPHYPTMPTLIERRFRQNREMPEAEVEALFETVLDAELMRDVAGVIERRLGRPLRPFDIWYDGFKQRALLGEESLDAATRARYPDAGAFHADIPRILRDLGFDAETAAFVASRIAVDPARGAGHASGPGLRDGMARLRTRVGAGGMDYKGYNIAVHELGHNVEQVLSTARIDHMLLRGVPNTAFTEAFAFVFQARDLELLGIDLTTPERERLERLDAFWGLCEITAVSLVDMRVWHWMYAHPEATPAELQEAVLAIARDVWNEHYAPVIGERDVDLLAIYSHMITGSMYLPDYAIGGVIRSEIESYLETRSLGAEMPRMCAIGGVTPGHWMQQAVGAPITAEPLLEATRRALARLGE